MSKEKDYERRREVPSSSGMMRSILRETVPSSLRTARWLLSIMIPVSLLVTLLGYSGVLGFISQYLNPFFHFLGLSGQSAFVFLTGIFLNIYSAIAVMTSLPLTMREMTILALMCLISHNLIVEILILKKTGSRPLEMILIRLGSSVLGAVMLNYLMPPDFHLVNSLNESTAGHGELVPLLKTWLINTSILSVKVIVLLTGLMILQKVLEDYGILEIMSKTLSPVLRVMGLPRQGSFLWIVANVVGLGYGSAIMLDQLERERITLKQNDIVNHHIAVCHSLLEDTLLFVAIGVSAFWITFPRLFLAIVIVWCYRLITRQFVLE
ncbi:MAG: nucleoside recognition domain-containing protein [Bacteroidetes bacterium]|nr:nucleoside recognition domain-containing protein [Bacteroidota bacterium]